MGPNHFFLKYCSLTYPSISTSVIWGRKQVLSLVCTKRWVIHFYFSAALWQCFNALFLIIHLFNTQNLYLSFLPFELILTHWDKVVHQVVWLYINKNTQNISHWADDRFVLVSTFWQSLTPNADSSAWKTTLCLIHEHVAQIPQSVPVILSWNPAGKRRIRDSWWFKWL